MQRTDDVRETAPRTALRIEAAWLCCALFLAAIVPVVVVLYLLWRMITDAAGC